VLLARVNLRLAGYTPQNAAAVHRKLYDRVNALPGIQATLARYSPQSGSNSSNSGYVVGYAPQPGESVEFETIQVAPSYPDALGMRLVDGRAIGLQDGPGTPKVAMVNEALTRHFFPGQRAIGRRRGKTGREPGLRAQKRGARVVCRRGGDSCPRCRGHGMVPGSPRDTSGSCPRAQT
jgi:hypothetical protein